MTKHDLALQAIDDAAQQARETLSLIAKARAAVVARDYTKAQGFISDANSSASYVDNIRLPNATRGLQECR